MARKSTYFKTIERMMDIGYEAKDIVKITGIPVATVYRIVDKLRTEARINFKELMEKDYLYKYQQNLENFSKTIRQCNEEIDKINAKYDELEKITMDALKSCPIDKHVSRSAYITNLISIRASRTTELKVMVAQRDHANEKKAKIFNMGPVVYRINQFAMEKMQDSAVPPMLQITKSEVIPEPPKEFVPDVEDLDVLREMEESNDLPREMEDEGNQVISDNDEQ